MMRTTQEQYFAEVDAERRRWKSIPEAIQTIARKDDLVGAFLHHLVLGKKAEWSLDAAAELILLMASRNVEQFNLMLKYVERVGPCSFEVSI